MEGVFSSKEKLSGGCAKFARTAIGPLDIIVFSTVLRNESMTIRRRNTYCIGIWQRNKSVGFGWTLERKCARLRKRSCGQKRPIFHLLACTLVTIRTKSQSSMPHYSYVIRDEQMLSRQGQKPPRRLFYYPINSNRQMPRVRATLLRFSHQSNPCSDLLVPMKKQKKKIPETITYSFIAPLLAPPPYPSLLSY